MSEPRVIPGIIHRVLYKTVRWEEEYGSRYGRDTSGVAKAEVVSSEVLMNDKMHAPVLDIDFHAELVPSSTDGHFHLYLDQAISWRKYKRVLKAMAAAGLLEKGYVKASLRRGYTDVRVPWLKKKR